MSGESNLNCITLKADAQVDTAYVAVKVSGDHTFAVAEASDSAIGILQYPVKEGEAARIAVGGSISFAMASTAITAGSFVKAGAAGKIVTTTDATTCLGVALDTATLSGDIISVLIK